MIVYVTFWIWSAMQSSPEHPGIIELSTFLISDDADDAMTCQHYNSRLAENGLLVAACLMMLLTVAYVCSDLYIIKKRKRANTRIAIRQENLFGPAGLSGMQSCCFCQGVVIFAVTSHQIYYNGWKIIVYQYSIFVSQYCCSRARLTTSSQNGRSQCHARHVGIEFFILTQLQ